MTTANAIHLYDDSCSRLFLNNGKEIKLDFDLLRYSSADLAQKELEAWARQNGVIQQNDQIAIFA